MCKQIIHIGLPKCGSTTLQRSLFPFCGVDYIGKCGLIGSTSSEVSEYYEFLSCFKSPDNFDRYRDKEFIFSDEGLTWSINAEKDIFSVLKQIEQMSLALPDAQILVVKRDNFSWTRSMVSMLEGTSKLSDDEVLRLAKAYQLKAFAPDNLLPELRKILGDRLTVIELDKLSSQTIQKFAKHELGLTYLGDQVYFNRYHVSPRQQDRILKFLASSTKLKFVRRLIPKSLRRYIWTNFYKRVR